ncbi:MAG: AAA family ATPase [Clostridia bacterium]|nr:AAA family ATPase [Clostridia bacterium]
MKLYIITGTCGAGKSTIKDELNALLDPGKYACIDSDETGLNWWDYAGTDHESQYGNDTLNAAIQMAGGRDLVFVSCLTPQNYMTETTVPEEVKATYYIALWAPDEVIYQRLRARPKERGFTSDEIIRPHIEYNQWIGRNRGKYQLFIDNEKQTPGETAEIIRKYIAGLPDGNA